MTLLYDLHMRYRVALFDLDYTLFDSAASEREALEKSFRTCGLVLEQEIFTKYQVINKDLLNNIKKKNFSMNTVWNEQINRKNLYGFESKNKFIHLTNIDIYNYFLKDY